MSLFRARADRGKFAVETFLRADFGQCPRDIGVGGRVGLFGNAIDEEPLVGPGARRP